jgi:hypothetical protein
LNCLYCQEAIEEGEDIVRGVKVAAHRRCVRVRLAEGYAGETLGSDRAGYLRKINYRGPILVAPE